MDVLKFSTALLALFMAIPFANAQSAVSARAPANFAPITAPCAVQPDGSCAAVSTALPLPTQAKQESVTLIAANTPAAVQTVYGGNYAFSQTCSAYGTVVLRYRGPDGATMLTLVSKTASDSTGATLVQLGSNAVVDATVSGTTGCNATLSRVP